jgi:hypothetical protein
MIKDAKSFIEGIESSAAPGKEQELGISCCAIKIWKCLSKDGAL